MRTFHIGGTAAHIATESSVESKASGKIKFINIRIVENKKKKQIVTGRNGKIEIVDKNGITQATYNVPYGSVLLVDEGAEVKIGGGLFEWDPYSSVIV